MTAQAAEDQATAADVKEAQSPQAPAPAPARRRDPLLVRIVAALSDVPGVVAIGMGGSRGYGTAVKGSDHDLIVFTKAREEVDQEQLRKKVEELGGKWQTGESLLLAEINQGPRKVELFFRDMTRIVAEIEAARTGKFRRTLNPLHTVGFLSTIVVSYATYVRPMWDPEGELKQLIESAQPYPDVLRERMVRTFLSDARLALLHAVKVKTNRDVAHLMGLYSRLNAAWALVLFALNRRYPIIDKAGRQLVGRLPLAPANYEFRSNSLFREAAAGDLKGAATEAVRLHREVTALARQELGAVAEQDPERANAGA